jgi:hypothetical protein
MVETVQLLEWEEAEVAQVNLLQQMLVAEEMAQLLAVAEEEVRTFLVLLLVSLVLVVLAEMDTLRSTHGK